MSLYGSATRTLGIIGILTSPMLLAEGLRWHFRLHQATGLDAMLGLLFLIGWACSAIGLRLRRATGRGSSAAWLLGVQLIGLSLASLQQIQDLASAPNTKSLLYRVADTAWPSSVAFMLVVGVFTLRARVLTGWKRWMPLVCGLALPVLFLGFGLGGRQLGGSIFGVHTTVAWALLGLAVATGERESQSAGAPLFARP